MSAGSLSAPEPPWRVAAQSLRLPIRITVVAGRLIRLGEASTAAGEQVRARVAAAVARAPKIVARRAA